MKNSIRSQYLIFFIAVVVLTLTFVGGARGQDGEQQERPRNVILFIADGFGPASATFARDFTGQSLALDGILVGAMSTYSTSAKVTDSAAAGTAFASGIKTYNGAVGVDTLQLPVGTLVEAAETRGLATGLVSTAAITHATPAAFSAHVASRGSQSEIAAQQAVQNIEVLLGGGLQYYVPSSEGGVREDGAHLLDAMRSRGYQVVSNRAELIGASETPVIGLFTKNHMAYEVDRDPDLEPSLAEMTLAAIELLEDDPDGFFLMVEAGRIDHAAHGNDPAGHVHDILAYDDAVAAALEFARRDGETLVVGVADHETGGLTLGRNVDGRAQYDWRPDVLARVSASTDVIVDLLEDGGDPASVLAAHAGIDTLDLKDWSLLVEGRETERLGPAIGEIVSRRALLGWTSYGHTAVDVNTYAAGPGETVFYGHRDNADVGRILADLLGLDLDAETRRLQADAAGTR